MEKPKRRQLSKEEKELNNKAIALRKRQLEINSEIIQLKETELRQIPIVVDIKSYHIRRELEQLNSERRMLEAEISAMTKQNKEGVEQKSKEVENNG